MFITIISLTVVSVVIGVATVAVVKEARQKKRAQTRFNRLMTPKITQFPVSVYEFRGEVE